MYGIRRGQTRVNARYWVVHIKRNGTPYSKRFYDGKCGGESQAKAQARAWLREIMTRTKAFTNLDFHRQKRSNNTSGVPGVHFLTTQAQPLGVWQARIKIVGTPARHRTFSVKKYGERQAYRLALKARQEMLASIVEKPYLYAETARLFERRKARRSIGTA